MTFLDPPFQQRAGIESTTVAALRTSKYEAGPLSTRGAALRQCLTAYYLSPLPRGRFEMKPSVVLLLAVMSLMSACSSRESQLDPIADQLSAAVDRCVIDVRDKGYK